MTLFQKIIMFLQRDMEPPKPWDEYHFLWIGLIIIACVSLFKIKKKDSELQLKVVLGTYGIIALLLEIAKQISWSCEIDPTTFEMTWDYTWYAAPFQLCTTPIYISLTCLFLKKSKFRTALLSYISFFTIIGSIVMLLTPQTCFTEDVLVNIHTMFLHCGSLVLSIYFLTNEYVKLEKRNYFGAIAVFIFFVGVAEILNIGIYKSGVLNDESFNMFYISPYFMEGVPLFGSIVKNIPFGLFLLGYIVLLSFLALIVYAFSYIINKAYIQLKEEDTFRTNSF